MRTQQEARACETCGGEPAREVAPEREHDPQAVQAAALFRALGDETRLGIIKQLREQGEVCVCDFAACCCLSQPTVSHHLKVLRDAGLVIGEKRGLWVHYRLNPQALERLRDLVP